VGTPGPARTARPSSPGPAPLRPTCRPAYGPGVKPLRSLLGLGLGLGLALASAAPGLVRAEGRRPPDTPVVIDGTGTVVGVLASYNGPAALVPLLAGDTLVAVRVEGDRILTGSTGVSFESADCSGPPLLSELASFGLTPLLPRSGVGTDGALLVETGEAPSIKGIQSRVDRSLPPPHCDVIGFTINTSVAPAAVAGDLSGLVPPFTLGHPDAAGARSPAAMSLETATGATLGPVVQLGFPVAGVAIREGDTVLLARVAGNQLTSGTTFVYFESADCSGPPLLEVPSFPGTTNLFEATGIGPGDTLLVQDGPPASVVVASRLDAAQASPPACKPASGSKTVFPARTVLDLDPSSFLLTGRLGPVGGRASSASRRSSGIPRLVDAAGRTVGLAYPNPTLTAIRGHVLVRADGRAGFLLASADRLLSGLRGNLPGYAFYEDSACAGPAFIQAPAADAPAELFRRTAIAPDGRLLVGEGPQESRLLAFRWASDEAPPGCLPEAPGSPEDALPLVPFLDLAGFTAPFHVQ
jgi:hypothetical protein